MSQLDDEKALLAFANVIAGALINAVASAFVLGIALLFCPAKQAIGMAIVAFFPVCFLTATWNARLYRKNKQKQEEAAR